MIYLDTTVLLVYTLTKLIEVERYKHVSKLFELINTEKVKAVTSFYALHEVFMFAIQNASDAASGRHLGKQAVLEILSAKLDILPMLTREERIFNRQLFKSIPDSSDIPHAVSAYLADCRHLVSYDEHFHYLPAVLVHNTPEDILALGCCRK